jgi:ABC-2 type transport system permease protein
MLSGVRAVAAREYLGYFRTATGWVVMALYLLLTGYAFTAETLGPGEPATMRWLFVASQWLLLLVAPAVSMRLISEEIRTGTLEALGSTPVGDGAIVFGKFVGAAAFLLTVLAPTAAHVGVLEAVADPDYGPIAAGYLGLILVGGVYLSAGLVFSALTKSQVVAFLLTLSFFFGWHMASTAGASAVGGRWGGVLAELSIRARLADFAKGVIDTGHGVFFVAASAFFLVVAGVVLESRRWR